MSSTTAESSTATCQAERLSHTRSSHCGIDDSMVHPPPPTAITTLAIFVPPPLPPPLQSTAVTVQPVAPLLEVGGNVVVEGIVGGKRKRRRKAPSGPVMSAVQKDKVREYAENVGWRLIMDNQEKMTRLCDEIGISTQKCRNWIINNRKTRTPSTKLTL